MKKPLPERIAALKARKEQLHTRLARLETKAKQVDRKRDTRRKIVVGAAVLSEIERNPRFAEFVREMLRKAVTRPQDQEAIADLLAVPAPPAPITPRSTEAPSFPARQSAIADVLTAATSIGGGLAEHPYRTFSKTG